MAPDHSWPSILSALVDGRDLSIGESEWAMGSVMAGEATSAQVAGLLVALRAKVRRSTRSSASGMRCSRTPRSFPVDPMALDIVEYRWGPLRRRPQHLVGRIDHRRVDRHPGREARQSRRQFRLGRERCPRGARGEHRPRAGPRRRGAR